MALLDHKQRKDGKSKDEIRNVTNRRWQEEWDEANSGRYAYSMIREVKRREDIFHEIDYITSIIITGHGPHMLYFYNIKKVLSPNCDWCADVEDTTYHTIVECPKWSLEEEKGDLIEASERVGLGWPATNKGVIL